MEELNREYEQLCLKLNSSFASGSVSSIRTEFENILLDSSLNDMTTGSLFGFVLFSWNDDYEYPGDAKSSAIIKNAVLTMQTYRKGIYPQVWRRLKETHLDLIKDLFPERF